LIWGVLLIILYAFLQKINDLGVLPKILYAFLHGIVNLGCFTYLFVFFFTRDYSLRGLHCTIVLHFYKGLLSWEDLLYISYAFLHGITERGVLLYILYAFLHVSVGLQYLTAPPLCSGIVFLRLPNVFNMFLRENERSQNT